MDKKLFYDEQDIKTATGSGFLAGLIAGSVSVFIIILLVGLYVR